MNIDVDVRGAQEAAALVDRLSRRLADNTPALTGLVDALTEVHGERFEGRGVRWKPVKPATQRIDRQQGRDPRPLVNTGALMRSLTTRGAPGQVIRVRRDRLTFGTRIHYARFQKNMGRNPVGTTRQQRRRLVDELRDLLLKDT